MVIGISLGSSTKSTRPVAIALEGILGNSEVSGSLAIIIPPACFTAFMPSVPSDPSPEKTMAMARGPEFTASELKNIFTVRCGGERVSLSIK